MLLNAEIKDDNYTELPRQQDAQYAYPAPTYLKADASTGQHFVDLNAAVKHYSGAWLFGKEHVQTSVGNLKAEWVQWCPVPAGIADGVLMRGNVIYQNPDNTYRQSGDQYEGVIRTEHNTRVFEGKTQHTFTGNGVPGGSMRVVADLRIALTEQLPYNPMIPVSQRQSASPGGSNYSGAQQQTQRPQQAQTYSEQPYATYQQPPQSQQPYYQPPAYQSEPEPEQTAQPQYQPAVQQQQSYPPRRFSQQSAQPTPASYPNPYSEQVPDSGF